MSEIAEISTLEPFAMGTQGIVYQLGLVGDSYGQVYSRRQGGPQILGLDERFDDRAQAIYAGFDPKTVFFPDSKYEKYPDAPRSELEAITEALNDHGQRCLNTFRKVFGLKNVVWLGLASKDDHVIISNGQALNKELDTVEDEHGNITRSPKTDVAVVAPPQDGELPITVAMGVADCLAIPVVDERTQAIGFAHAGRPGTALRTSEKAALLLKGEFGSKTKDLVAYLGEGVCTACYPLDGKAVDSFIADFGGRAEVEKVLEQYPGAIRRHEFQTERFAIDQYAFNKSALGQQVHEIVEAPNCTARMSEGCASLLDSQVPIEADQSFFSHMRVKGQKVGWQMENGQILELDTFDLTTPHNLAAIERG